MKLPHFPFRSKLEPLSKQDDKVFAEASELASLRLEQCIADLEISVPTMRGTSQPGGIQPLRKYSNPFLGQR